MSNALPIQTVEALCIHLDVSPSDLKQLVASMPSQYRRYPKRSRTGKVRMMYDPHLSLRLLQAPLNRLLRQIPIPDVVHGWRTGRSPRTNAASHVGKPVVIKVDLENFFPNCHYQSVRALFLELGCSAEVAEVLMHVTTAEYHLPQGFLTSPAIANLLLARTDRRLMGLAKQRGADYSRFGDDLALSGPQSALKMVPLAQRIIKEAGHKVNAQKFTDVGIRYASQQQEICAVAVNENIRLRKQDYRHYRDLIRRCVTYGPACEMRDHETLLQMKARVLGYVNYVRGINRQSAHQLQTKFDQIQWTLDVGNQ